MKKLFSIALVIALGFIAIVSAETDMKTSNKSMIDEDMRMCTMQYDPVCGIDGKTYGNGCMAGNTKIAYKGECEMKSETMIDYELYGKYNNNKTLVTGIKSILSKVSESRLIKLSEQIDVSIESVKRSKIAVEIQKERITKLTFIKDMIDIDPLSY